MPSEILEKWKCFALPISSMSPIHINRCLHFSDSMYVELIGYCDASQIAYDAVLYSRVICQDKVYVNILCSKSRDVPLNKGVTMPRLELNSALLLTNLASTVYALIKNKITNVFLYSDSTITLAWLKTETIKLNPYVANRVEKINSLNSNFEWLYIYTKENSADILFRGIAPEDISNSKLWFHGPNALSNRDFVHVKFPINIP